VEELRAPSNAISIRPPAHPGEANLNVSEIIHHVETRVLAVMLLFGKN
jgi:hypothetical protein